MIEIPQSMVAARTMHYLSVQALIDELGLAHTLVLIQDGIAPIAKVQSVGMVLDVALAIECGMTAVDYLDCRSVVDWLDAHALGSMSTCDN